ncbi:hypothetical protein EST38_g6612 [Candolleomyces aberdarensis]|uniref:Transposase n=1 Tax=Candolleomyces aberdarensis TaxID=2316362 RepID=A0A4Q2DK68_9AGAR|nr:hypothetical protein EST38_g6612 [Candolleomyces aberdarensis]
MHNKYFTPRRATQAHLAGVHDILLWTNQYNGDSETIFKLLPKDPRTLSARFLLEPTTTTYICCPECHKLYPFIPNDRPANPQICDYRKTPASEPCGAKLWKERDYGPYGIRSSPVKKYVHQDLKSWLGRLLSRPGIENLLENRAVDAKSEVDDIWGGEVFRNFKDRAGNPYYPGPDNELRLAFSLSVDGFDPYQNKVAKQSAASTGIWMVLLNLPPHLRYLEENIYVAGVIPGPSKPSSDQLNHYMELIVREAKEFWENGVFFSRTFEHRLGRLARSIIAPLVCDLLGARQVIGYPGTLTAHYFCTACDLDLDDIHVIEPSLWPAKDIGEIRMFAQLYRDAPNEKLQQYIFQGSGWRWSPLFELEYWDPVKFTAIDSMHSLDLNLVKNHCRVLFKIDTKKPSGDASRTPALTVVKRLNADSDSSELSSLERCQGVIFDNTRTLAYDLLGFHRSILYTFCLDYGINRLGGSSDKTLVGTRWVLAKYIYRWRQEQENVGLKDFLQRYPKLSTQMEEMLDARNSNTPERSEPAPSSTGTSSESATGRSQLPKPAVLRKFAHGLLSLESADSSDAMKLYLRLTSQTLEHFCHILEINPILPSQPQPQPQPRANKKKMLFELVVRQMLESEELRDKLLGQYPEEEGGLSGSAFLGKDVMEAIWSDMKATRLPSWISPVPHDWGSTRRGKLSANNWRIIAVIHLPITLIRLYGHTEGRKRDLLSNFMELVKAIRIATMNATTQQQIDQYNSLILRYSAGVKQLFPDYEILPSHHMSLHIGDTLRHFGPKHSHDSPHYERYINLFHRMNNNHKLGDLEGTLLRTSVRHANIIAMLKDDTGLLETASNLVQRMTMNDKERLRGFRLAEMFSLDSSLEDGNGRHRSGELDVFCHNLLCSVLQAPPTERNVSVSRRVVFLEAITHRNSVYAVWNSLRYKDSAILYIDQEGSRNAGVIQEIFKLDHRYSSGKAVVLPFVILRKYNQMAEQEDPYRQYGIAGGFSCELELTSTIEIVAMSQVLCHVAVTSFAEHNFTHILPINRELLSLDLELEETLEEP